ncbi:MAG: hypothetical protein MUO23_14545 [Anaerolineales bacterium]|nr:hypothetical protein [Anaerolineales bacterium]
MRRRELTATSLPATAERYEVGQLVDVFCDHTDQDNRVRTWLQGVVVQAEYKMVAIQFNQDVYLTDGWMVPDRVLWCQQGGDNIRPSTSRRRPLPPKRRKRR